jgi:hypothetical protein
MAVLPSFYEPNSGLFADFATTSSVAIAQYQMVAFGADDDTITGTSDANLCIGIAMAAVSSSAAGASTRVQVRLNGSAIVPMIGNGTVTRGKLAVATGTAGKVTDTGATPDARTVVGRFLASSSTDGDRVPVLIG